MVYLVMRLESGRDHCVMLESWADSSRFTTAAGHDLAVIRCCKLAACEDGST
jgi:hypothetical protein